ncbi:MAG TPA: Uma2 family endonuclease [Polyangiaceae bacterium LLY-WYZ-15_(1-7)]|nr:Uma2 family endonuclease [Polyangiaceae bacterium LLY-WYZ-15_(1-7)]HJL06292.1 Uma2 family endonuclease [Polyangiaceae bacterium LLY-WYZ-15_(1-7)]HJL10813.1 Uma2 family endonuclease [Polyangiaceae bacterium LLY-WYZ-15_(1-7)]HJL30192.1 Uma2 family endonuclease [Polyangiaceae bacterium LLY-WYZ-15_(1-7)]HJL47028.1 Uma2 family endonuclease [Polyangiaceae bacterium LLY-WYZ-15_(1-7)]
MNEPAPHVTPAEYLRLDAEAEGKLELLNGTVVAMAGASPRHNLIVANLAGELREKLRRGPCLVMTQDQRVHVAATESFVYPDVVVVCDRPELDEAHRPASLRNPSAVVEVLSPSTLDHDMGAKLGHYRRIPSVREVLFVRADERALTRVARQGDGSWRLDDLGPEGEVELAGVTLSLDAIYEKVDALPA